MGFPLIIRETTSYNNFKGKGYGGYTPNENDGAISPMMSHQEGDSLGIGHSYPYSFSY